MKISANYSDYPKNIYATPDDPNRFFENLLFGGSKPLQNRDLRVSVESDTDTVPRVPVKDDNVPVSVPVKDASIPVKRKEKS
ncbi:MAG: hypothetical protein LBQ15_01390 [Clostridium sp.]|nr:hypothetical protein [Clostridium sp.]